MTERLNAVAAARDYLEKADGPVSFAELSEKTGITHHEIPALLRNEVINAWYKLTDKTVSVDGFNSWLESDAGKIAEYMTKEPGRIIRVDEISDVLKIEGGQARYILSHFETRGAVVPYYTLTARADCGSCFNRLECKRNMPAERCGLFTDDYRLAG